MPTYTAAADIYNVMSKKIVAECADDVSGTDATTTAAAAIVENALERAESVVDSYVGKVTEVPLDVPVAANIQHAVLTLAKCYLYGRRPGVTPDEAREDCAKIMEWLEAVAAGETELDAVTLVDVADSDLDDEVFTENPFA